MDKAFSTSSESLEEDSEVNEADEKNCRRNEEL
jgi:hypothetical protein